MQDLQERMNKEVDYVNRSEGLITKIDKLYGDNINLQLRNTQLLEAVKKAHEILLHEMDNGRTPSMLQGVGLGYFEDIIAGIKS